MTISQKSYIFSFILVITSVLLGLLLPLSSADRFSDETFDYSYKLNQGDEIFYNYREDALETRVTYSGAGELSITDRGISFDSDEVAIKEIKFIVYDSRPADIVAFEVNDDSAKCVTHRLRSNAYECTYNPGSPYSTTNHLVGRTVDYTFFPLLIFGIITANRLLYQRTYENSIEFSFHSSFMKKLHGISDRLTSKFTSSTVLYIGALFVAYMLFWHGQDLGVPLILPDNTTIYGFGQALGGSSLWTNPVIWLSYLVEEMIALVFGAALHTRIFYSALVLGLVIGMKAALKHASRLLELGVKEDILIINTVAIIAVLNPFVIQRLLLGQRALLLALPLFLVFLAKLYSKNPDSWSLIALGLLIGLTSQHMIPIVLISVTLGAIFNPAVVRNLKNKPSARLLTAAIVLTFSLGARLLERGETAGQFDYQELLTWAPQASQWQSVLANSASGFGYFTDGQILNAHPSFIGWQLLSLPLLIVSGLGLLRLYRANSSRLGLVMTFIIFSVLSLSIYTVIDGPGNVFQLLYDNWLLRGLRESQKLQAATFILSVIGSLTALLKLNQRNPILVAPVLTILLVTASLLTLWPSSQSSAISCDYSELNLVLSSELDRNDKVLALPAQEIDYLAICPDTPSQNPARQLIGDSRLAELGLSYTDRLIYDTETILQLRSETEATAVVILYGHLLPEDRQLVQSLNCSSTRSFSGGVLCLWL